LVALVLLVPAISRAEVEMNQYLDIAYSEVAGVDPRLLSLDIFTPIDDGFHPVVVMIHGGGWQAGDKTIEAAADVKSVYFVSQGYVFVSINYRLSPAIAHPVHVQDVARALAYVHTNIAGYGGDSDRIYVMGHSAGAHLAALVATDETYLAAEGKEVTIMKGVILLDGAGYDIPLQRRMSQSFFKALFDAAFPGDADAQWAASPIAHVAPGKGIPPFLIFYLADRPVSRVQSRNLASALVSAGIKATLAPVRGKTHRSLNRKIGIREDTPTQAIMSFLSVQ
jgi:arylformamidase